MVDFSSFVALLLLAAPSWAQQPDSAALTLAHCEERLRAHYPLVRQVELNNQQLANTVRKLDQLRRLPQVAVSGQASYQSEVTQLPVEIPGQTIPTLAKDQYRLTVDGAETLYEGGLTRQQQAVEYLTNQVQNQQVEVELYRLRTRLHQVYFGVLLTDESAAALRALQTDLGQRRKTLVGRQRNGVATAQDVARLDAEVLKLTQQLRELSVRRRALTAQLSQLVGEAVPAAAKLAEPFAAPLAPPRPEWALYQLQKNQLAGQLRLTAARLAPRLSVFGQVGYGRPTLNFLQNDFGGWYLGGLRLSWNLSNYYNRRRDQQTIWLNQQQVDVQQAVFSYQQNLELVQQQAVVDRFASLLETDAELIRLREKVRATAAVQLDNGIITFADYFTEASNLTYAQLDQRQHRVQLLQAQTDLLTISGAPAAAPTSPR